MTSTKTIVSYGHMITKLNMNRIRSRLTTPSTWSPCQTTRRCSRSRRTTTRWRARRPPTTTPSSWTPRGCCPRRAARAPTCRSPPRPSSPASPRPRCPRPRARSPPCTAPRSPRRRRPPTTPHTPSDESSAEQPWTSKRLLFHVMRL